MQSDPIPLPTPYSKRKASEIEKDLNPSNSLKKRVSFGGCEVLEYSLSQLPEDPDVYLESSKLQLQAHNSFLNSLKTLNLTSTQALNTTLNTLSNTLRLSSVIDPDHLKSKHTEYETQHKSLQSLQLQKEEIIKNCQKCEENALKDLSAVKKIENELKAEIKTGKMQDSFSKLKNDAYKKVFDMLGVKCSIVEGDYFVKVKGNEFQFVPMGNSYLVTGKKNKEEILSAGTHKLHKAQVKFLGFRLIDCD